MVTLLARQSCRLITPAKPLLAHGLGSTSVLEVRQACGLTSLLPLLLVMLRACGTRHPKSEVMNPCGL